ncbi:MAG: glutamate--tRNA ligase [Bdellovibrionales bacterium]|nr:glutamate--tRNA ligase [Bdellovibrionales bacterium]
MKNIRVRFAPSPTGALHVGGARTALFNFLFAKKYGGRFILRVEDTDLDRNQEHFLTEQLTALKWLGLDWDEGMDKAGEYGPYRQSQRLDVYNQYAQKLLDSGKAYYCFLTDDELAHMKETSQKEGKPFRVKSPYRNWSQEEAKKKQNVKPVIRFKMPETAKNYVVDDVVRGRVEFPSDMIGDFVLIRSNGLPVYNFCCAVDDALMKISHIFRAEEHLPNTLRQLIIFEALGWASPVYGHLSLILSTDKKKLSKREGALSCLEYKEQGHLPSALNNFLALLGWNPKDNQEVFSFSELISKFSEKNLNPAGAVFDENKLKWINAQHIRSMDYKEFWKMLQPLLDRDKINLPFLNNESLKEKSFHSLKSSFSTLKEAVEVFRFLSYDYFKIDDSVKEIFEWSHTKNLIQLWKEELEKVKTEYISLEDFKNIQNSIKTKLNIKGALLFKPLRAVMIGQVEGLELKAIIELIPRETLIQRSNQLLSQMC